MANISQANPLEEKLAQALRLLGQPNRVKILLTIGNGEACVCHLEAYTGLRQAVISQHLMLLREAGYVTAVREGRNIYYRLTRPELIETLYNAARFCEISLDELKASIATPVVPCPCPHCNPGSSAGLDCTQLHPVE